MTQLCEIEWVDSNGQPTPDMNPAVCRVRCKARVEQHHGRAIEFSESKWFACCAKHAERLSDPGMHIWECEPL
jgi:hypothetical protein